MLDLVSNSKREFLERLADDIIYNNVSEEFISLDFLSEPIPFSKAPENTVLLVMADTLESCNPMPVASKKQLLLKGSIIIKISEDVKNTLLRPSSNENTPGQGLMYSAISFFTPKITEDGSELNVAENHLSTYNKYKTEGLVIPISEVLVNGTPLFADANPEHLKQGIDMSELLTAFANQIIVVVSDVQGRQFRRSWLDAGTHAEAIRRTLDSSDSYSQISDIVKVEVVGCL